MSWRETLLNNYGWKLASLIMALVIWFTVARQLKIRWVEDSIVPKLKSDPEEESQTVQMFDLPIKVLESPGQAGTFRIKPDRVQEVHLQADKSQRSSHSLREKIHVFVDLSNLPPGTGASTNPFAGEVLVHSPSGTLPILVKPATVLVERIPVPAAGAAPKPARNEQEP